MPLLPKFMRRPQADVELHAYGETFTPGSDIEFRARILSRNGFEVRRARISIACVETYWVVTSDGKTTHHQKRTRRISEVSHAFMEGGVIRPGLAHREESTLRLPDDSPPSVEGKRANLSWRLRLAIDVPGARDITAETPLTVVLPRAGSTRDRPSHAVDERFEECDLHLEVPGGRVDPGSPVEGRLRLSTRARCDFPEIRIELTRREKAGVKKGFTVVDSATIATDAVYEAEQRREWSYLLRVPEGMFPTTSVSDTSVSWEVKAVFSRSRRTDFRVGAEIEVG